MVMQWKLRGMTTFEWVCFEGVFRLEGISGKPLRLTVKHRWLHFEWVLLWKWESQREREREQKLLSSLLLWTNRIFRYVCMICIGFISFVVFVRVMWAHIITYTSMGSDSLQLYAFCHTSCIFACQKQYNTWLHMHLIEGHVKFKKAYEWSLLKYLWWHTRWVKKN